MTEPEGFEVIAEAHVLNESEACTKQGSVWTKSQCGIIQASQRLQEEDHCSQQLIDSGIPQAALAADLSGKRA